MATITAIKKQVKSDRFSIYLDGKYAVGLSSWQLLELRIKIGDEVDETKQTSLLQHADFGKLYDKTLSWSLLRPHSVWELDQYLRKKTEDLQLRHQVKERILEKNYVNDKLFAERWAEGRRRSRAISKRKLAMELRSKRVDETIISEVMKADAVQDIESLRIMVEKKRRLSRFKDDSKLMQYLARQGYGYDDIKRVLRND